MLDMDLFISKILHLVNEREQNFRKYRDDICDHCKNKVECKGKDCDQYISGDEGFIDGKPVKFKWDCQDFDYGTCPKMENTPCEGCSDTNYAGFEYKDDDYDYMSALVQIKALIENGQSAIETNMRLKEIIERMKDRLEKAGSAYD